MDPNNNQTPNEPVVPQPSTEPSQQPVAPVVTPPVGASAVSGGPSKNNLKVPIIVGSVLAVLALIGLAVWLTVFSVTKDDYKKANTAIEDARTAYNTTGDKVDDYMSELMSSYSTESEIDSAKSDFDKAYSDYKTKVAAIKDEKAMRDGDVKKSYEEFESQNKRFTETIDGLMEIAPTLKDAQKECVSSNISSTISSATPDTLLAKFDEAMEGCKEVAVKMSESKLEPIADYGKKAVTGMEKMRTYIEKMQSAAQANDRNAFQDAYYGMMDDESIKDMSTSGMSDMDKLMDEVEVKDELESLSDLVAEKAK